MPGMMTPLPGRPPLPPSLSYLSVLKTSSGILLLQEASWVSGPAKHFPSSFLLPDSLYKTVLPPLLPSSLISLRPTDPALWGSFLELQPLPLVGGHCRGELTSLLVGSWPPRIALLLPPGPLHVLWDAAFTNLGWGDHTMCDPYSTAVETEPPGSQGACLRTQAASSSQDPNPRQAANISFLFPQLRTEARSVAT